MRTPSKNNGKLYENRAWVLMRQLTIIWDMTGFEKQHAERVG